MHLPAVTQSMSKRVMNAELLIREQMTTCWFRDACFSFGFGAGQEFASLINYRQIVLRIRLEMLLRNELVGLISGATKLVVAEAADINKKNMLADLKAIFLTAPMLMHIGYCLPLHSTVYGIPQSYLSDKSRGL